MELKDKDLLYKLFAELPDEHSPLNFNERVMLKIHKEAALREKKRMFLEFAGYASGCAAILVASYLVVFFLDVSLEMPKIKPLGWSFPALDYDFFGTQSFRFSLFIGGAALVLLFIDSKIRHYIKKIKDKKTNSGEPSLQTT